MPRYIHDVEGMTYACPECGKGGDVWLRTHPNKDYEHRCRCHKCGSTFDEPVERPKNKDGSRGVARPRSSAAQKLIDAEPEDLVTDGGTKGECDRCHTTTNRTTLTGEFRCERCARHVANRNRNSSREEGQDALDEYATHGGNQCSECGAYLPEEIDEGAGVYCNECGTGQLVTDGGQDADAEFEFFVIDETGPTVTAGPFDDEDDARAHVDGPSDIIATRAVLDLIEMSSTTLRWANRDGPDVVTDGGVISGEEIDDLGAYYCTHCETRFQRADYDDPSRALEEARDCALSHAEKSAVRFDPQLEEDDYQPVDDEPELMTDGGLSPFEQQVVSITGDEPQLGEEVLNISITVEKDEAGWMYRTEHPFDPEAVITSRDITTHLFALGGVVEKVVESTKVQTDGGEEISSKWTLECMDCDWSETVNGTEHPAEGPPDLAEKAVRLHKNTTDESHIVRVKGTHVVEDQDVDPSLLTDGGVPDFDRVAVGTCRRCGDEVPIRFLEDDVCVGCVHTQANEDGRTPLTDGGRIVSRCDICHNRPAEGLLGDGRDACRRCADRVTRESRSSRRPVATDGGRDVDACPRCGGPMAAVAIAGPSEAKVAPCGCEVAPQDLPKFSSEPLRTAKVLPENLPGQEHDELALNLSRAVADYINAENPEFEEVASVYFATAFNFNRDVGVGEEAMLTVLLKHVDAEDLNLEAVNEVVDGPLQLTRGGVLDRVRRWIDAAV